MTQLEKVLQALTLQHGDPQPPYRTVFELVMWENAGYLVDDTRRDDIMRGFPNLSPDGLLSTPFETLLQLAARGGMRPQARIDHWLEIATLARDLPAQPTRRDLKRFPGIGDPGVDKLLLFTGRQPILALDSNALRVLLRLGYGEEDKNYPATYRSVQKAAQAELPRDCPTLTSASLVLRRHGQSLCRRTSPQCALCPVTALCAYSVPKRAR
ncbi:MAG TPA: hypothetical protein VGO93_03455 [Candidatus Xenobia bacterium]